MKRLFAILIVLVFGCAAHASLAPRIYNPGFEESVGPLKPIVPVLAEVENR